MKIRWIGGLGVERGVEEWGWSERGLENKWGINIIKVHCIHVWN